jgi:hypothetical protein
MSTFESNILAKEYQMFSSTLKDIREEKQTVPKVTTLEASTKHFKHCKKENLNEDSCS